MKAIIGDICILSGVAVGTSGVWVQYGMPVGLMAIGVGLIAAGIGMVRSA